MIHRGHDLSIVRQAKVLKLARSTVYYEPRPVLAEDLALMRRLHELHLDYPFAGAHMLRSLLRVRTAAVETATVFANVFVVVRWFSL